MPPEAQARVRDIGRSYRWTDPSGHVANFLSEDEIKNLSIPRGTLTHEERETINHHIVATIKMLEALPWPRHLKNVSEYAGGHHERMDGKGYPRADPGPDVGGRQGSWNSGHLRGAYGKGQAVQARQDTF